MQILTILQGPKFYVPCLAHWDFLWVSKSNGKQEPACKYKRREWICEYAARSVGLVINHFLKSDLSK
jgi:hypothetical protein